MFQLFKVATRVHLPRTRRAVRWKERPLKAELISRLKRLEDEIKRLRESTEEANRVNRCSCSGDTVRLEENAAGGQRGRLIVGGGFSRYGMHDALVSVEDQIQKLHYGIEDWSEQLAEGNDEEILSAFIFGYSFTNRILRDYHPTAAQIQFL